MIALIYAAKGVLKGIYALHKVAPVKRRISLISRQSDEPSLDMRMIEERFRKQHPDVDVKILCRSLDGGIIRKLSYALHMIGPQMHAIATSRVVLLDGYCIAASVLDHKQDTRIVQMWHAMGCFKKFGRSVVDKEEGSSRRIADAMEMHKGYFAYFASGTRGIKAFADAFGCSRERGIVMPLPRYDHLTNSDTMSEVGRRITAAYPVLKEKKNILYAPTFRKSGENDAGISSLMAALDEDAYNIIYAPHPLALTCKEHSKYIYSGFSTIELMSVSDAVISDYSALIFESALAGVPTYLYTHDYDSYVKNRSFYIDMKSDINLPMYEDARDIMQAVENDECDISRLDEFVSRFIDKTDDATGNIVKYIFDML